MRKKEFMIQSLKTYLRYGKKSFRKFRGRSSYFVNSHQVIRYLQKNDIQDPILLSGFPKSGNTWTRFFIFNYFNILLNNAEETLTFQELDRIQKHVLGENILGNFVDGFPVFYRTHWSYRPLFDHFRVIYIYRNPLDTLVSYYHWNKDRHTPFSNYPPHLRLKMADVDFFVGAHINQWIEHYKATKDKSQIVLCYEKMRTDPHQEFSRLLQELKIEVNADALYKAIEFSSAKNIKKMGQQTGQLDGPMSTGKFLEKFEFVRNSQTGQYKNRLREETTYRVSQTLMRNGVDISEVNMTGF